jgi:hypothetical protein
VECNFRRDLPITVKQSPVVLSCAGAWEKRFDELVPGYQRPALQIRIRRKWNGKSYGPPKSRMSRKPVEMTKGLATVLEVWRHETMYAKNGDLLFPSYRKEGKQPRLGSMIVEDYIRPAAILAGVWRKGAGKCTMTARR